MKNYTPGFRALSPRPEGSPLLALFILLILMPLTALAAPGDRSGDGIWTDLGDEGQTSLTGSNRMQLPTAYHVFSLDMTAVKKVLDQAPMEQDVKAADGAILNFPMPDGTFQRFAVVESPILSEEAQAQIPDMRTYQAQGLDDPAATLRFDLGYWGFRAYGRTSQGTLWIDPWELGDRSNYISAWKHDFESPLDPLECGVADDYQGQPGNLSVPFSGDTLHTYRLIPTLTGEYGAFFGGISPALSAATTTFNRVNSIYEIDTSIRFTIVAWVAYDNPASDPFPNGSVITSSLLTQNQGVVDGFYGSGAYDIGHILTQGSGGGLAQLGVACNNTYKARGGTGRTNPQGDPFDVDYVAHEVGHQMGAHHTFNGSSGACNGNRTFYTAYEPGSGTTIMAYAGICAGENVQSNSDPYFHVVSLEEIIAFRNSTSCQSTTSTGNTPPVANAGPDAFIPRSTPFYVVGGYSDADGDAATYCWEQYDLGNASPPTDAYGPLFRSFNPTSSNFRYFPDLSQILAGASDPWEITPSVDRSLTLRLTVRDNRAGGGGTDDDELELSVSGAPFEVIYPNGGESFVAGQPLTVTWNVGGGAVAESVNIFMLSGGFTLLAGSVPNTGSANITMPCGITTGDARIWVDAIAPSNIGVHFFDVSNAPFSLTDGLPDYAPYAVWEDNIIPNSVNDPVLPTSLVGDDNTNLWWAVANFGDAWPCETVEATMNRDDVPVNVTPLGTPPGFYNSWGPATVTIPGGRHTLWQEIDAEGIQPEYNEDNNSYGRQWVWQPQPLASDTQVLRAKPPVKTAGHEHIPMGATSFQNLDGMRITPASGWWRGMAVSQPTEQADFDILLYTASTGVENGFDASALATSAVGGWNTDGVISNRNTMGNLTYDVGVLNWDGEDTDYRLESRESITPLAVGENVDAGMAEFQMLSMEEVTLSTSDTGVISIVLTTNATQPVTLAVFNPDFTEGSIYSANHYGLNSGDGRLVVELDNPASGFYGVAIYRSAFEGTEPFSYNLEVFGPVADLAAVTLAGSHAPLIPRNNNDIPLGDPVPAPTQLDGDVFSTYLYMHMANLGTATANPFNLKFTMDEQVLYDSLWPFGDVPGNPSVVYSEYLSVLQIRGGRHTAGLYFDNLNTNIEINEDNNFFGEQWVWNPTQMTPESVVQRLSPPMPQAGWELVPDGVTLFDNVDGMRTQVFDQGPGGGDGYWGAVALLPHDNVDLDLRLHTPTTGPDNGFDSILEESTLGGSFTDLILIDFDGGQNFGQAWDVGVVQTTGTANYTLQSTRSLFINDAGMVLPSTFGTYSIQPGEAISLTEFSTYGQTGNVTFNLDILHEGGNADFGAMVYARNDETGFYRKFDYLAFVEAGGPGVDKSMELTLPSDAYYGLVVYKMNHLDVNADLTYSVAFRPLGLADAPDQTSLPTVTRIEGVYPNPFNPQTTVTLAMKRSGQAQVKIYDLQGRLVRTLVDGELSAGRHELRWTGVDQVGRTVPSGVYFVRAVHPDGVDQRRMSLVK